MERQANRYFGRTEAEYQTGRASSCFSSLQIFSKKSVLNLFTIYLGFLSIPRPRRSPGGGHGNPMDREV